MRHPHHNVTRKFCLISILFFCLSVAFLITACGGSGGDDSDSDNNPPEAVLSADPTSGDAPLSVDFDASGSSDPDGDLLTFEWDFGDGNTRTGSQSESHIYQTAGDYTARVTVADAEHSASASIDITVSAVSGQVSVPDVINLTQNAAQITIENAGLILGSITTNSSDTIAAGCVVNQDPVAGVTVPVGSDVDLVISTGPAVTTVSVPNLIGLSQADATSAITDAELTLGTVTTENSDIVASGNVISQNPAAGQEVEFGATVDITVSLGPALVSVPDVLNQTQTEAEATITAAGLVMGTLTSENSDTVAADRVIRQDPIAGENVSPASAVDLVISLGSASGLPPDPASVAPAVDRTVPTNLADSVAFLYTGSNPIQTGVAPDTIVARRTVVLRGRVLSQDGAPLSGVNITILNHMEFGQTLSRADGMFDLVVNGGGDLTVVYALDGYLTSQRQVDTSWLDYVILPDVVLIPLDTAVTTVDFSEPMQVARGTQVTDDDGTRQATLFCPQGTTAEMVLPDGSTQALDTLNIRATEYTVGDNGPEAMPAMLPPTSAYTYCVDLTVDEAIAAGAHSVNFSQPLYYYVENFLDFAVGGIVPNGYYDAQNARWIPSKDGRVIEILGITADVADVDIDGDGLADDTTALSTLGITETERRELAVLYSPGQTLWRVPLSHFSPCDQNWGFGVSPDADPPGNGPPQRRHHRNNPCEEDDRCIIEFQNQILRESLPLAGTPYTLNYRSERVDGFQAGRTLDITLSGDEIPASLQRIELEIHVAGALAVAESFDPSTNIEYRYVWNGEDIYERDLQGEQPVTVRTGYVYNALYGIPFSIDDSSFGGYPGDDAELIPTRDEVILWKEHKIAMGTWAVRGQGMGGWTLDVHHTYSPVSQTVHLGDGTRQSSDLAHPVVSVKIINHPRAVTALPDGALYIIDSYQLKRIDMDGNATVLAGAGTGFSGDGGPALEAEFNNPSHIDVHPDGSIYIADTYNHRIRKIDPDGMISTVAGNGALGRTGDDGPATEAAIAYPWAVVLAPSGGFYIAQGLYGSNEGIRYVTPDGSITTIAGQNGVWGVPGDDGPATDAYILPRALDLGPDGSLYALDAENRIRKITPDGIIHTVAGNGTRGFSGDGGPAELAQLSIDYANAGIHVEPDDSIYFTDSVNNRIRMVDSRGYIHTIAGRGGKACPGTAMWRPTRISISTTRAVFRWTAPGRSTSPCTAVYAAFKSLMSNHRPGWSTVLPATAARSIFSSSSAAI